MNTSKHFQIHRKKGRRLLDEIPNGLHREPEAASADEGEGDPGLPELPPLRAPFLVARSTSEAKVGPGIDPLLAGHRVQGEVLQGR